MHNTYLQTRDDKTIVLKYHATDVITWYSDGRIVVDVDGWQTSTTKLRLNEFLPDGFRCYSDKGIWYIADTQALGLAIHTIVKTCICRRA